MQKTVAWTLREFQRYLVSKCGAKPINESEVFRFARGTISVDARIVSVEDIADALSYLDRRAQDARNPARERAYQVAKAEIVLGFFAGLRRMEGLGLRRIDYISGANAEVLVRTTETRDLKTANATRRIPIALMTAPFQEFLDPLEICFNTSRNDQAEVVSMLFNPSSDDVVVPLVHEALQAVTGDETLHGHTLRHSFCSLNLARLMLGDLPQVPDLLPHLEKTCAWMQAGKALKRALYGKANWGDHAWYMSSLMGHSSPGMSLGYAHVFDLLLSVFLKESTVFGQCEDSEFRSAMPQSKAQSYSRFPSRSAVPSPQSTTTPALHAEIAREVFLKRFKRNTLHLGTRPIIQNQSWIEQTWDLLSRFGRSDLLRAYDLPTTRFEPDRAAHILTRAMNLAKLRTTQGKYRHPMMNQPTRDDRKKDRGCCPILPRSPFSRTLVKEMAEQLEERALFAPEQVKNVLRHHAENVLPNSVRVLFAPPLDATLIEAYVEMLQQMCPATTRFHCRMGDDSGNARSVTEILLSCGLPLDSAVGDPADGRIRRDLPVGGLTIEPVRSTKEETATLSEALRFVLLMGAIAFD